MESAIRRELEFVYNKKLREVINEKKVVNFDKSSFELGKVEFVRSDVNLDNVFYRNLFSGKPVNISYSGYVKLMQKDGIFRNLRFADHRISLYFDNESGEFIIKEFDEVVFIDEF